MVVGTGSYDDVSSVLLRMCAAGDSRCASCQSDDAVRLNADSDGGFIGSVVVDERQYDDGCGTSRCPWIISGQPGQVSLQSRSHRLRCVALRQRTVTQHNASGVNEPSVTKRKGEERKGRYLYSAFYILCISQSAQAWITQFYLQIHHACRSFVSVHQMVPPLTEVRDIQLQLTTIHRPRRDERLSWPGWLAYSGRFSHISGHPFTTGRAQDRESSTQPTNRTRLQSPTSHLHAVRYVTCK